MVAGRPPNVRCSTRLTIRNVKSAQSADASALMKLTRHATPAIGRKLIIRPSIV
jgi:hypothetical protein